METSLLRIVKTGLQRLTHDMRTQKRQRSGGKRHVVGFLIGISFGAGILSLAYARGLLLSEYETFLPNTAQLVIPQLEKTMLESYLDSPNDKILAEQLSILHIIESIRVKRNKMGKGKMLHHTILAHYFLQRCKLLRSESKWVDTAFYKTQRKLDDLLFSEDPIRLTENYSAHEFFRETFHFKQKNRYLASEKLLDEIVENPNNVYTAFAITALNLWIGGEADYEDPTILYNFVIGSYFSLRTMDMAQQLEESWLEDPSNNERFRMASILGGFSTLQRRWLASLHSNQAALTEIDNEHRQWRLIHRSFHAFTVGIPFFEEPENFQEGLFALLDGFAHCEEELVRTCSDRPRFSFNQLGFVLTLIDFFIKAGDLQAAEETLKFRFSPDQIDIWEAWDLGRDPWLHRETHLAEISELYQNADPSDDPLHFQLKRRKWGTNTTTCQTCHQTQSQVWTEEEFNTVILPPEEVATVGEWPEVSTTWYGELIND